MDQPVRKTVVPDGAGLRSYVVVLCTAPKEISDRIAASIVEERLAACVNISPVRSHFVWDGKPCREDEELMIIKTEAQMLERIKDRIRSMHSYLVPEIIAIPVVWGDQPYLSWITDSLIPK